MLSRRTIVAAKLALLLVLVSQAAVAHGQQSPAEPPVWTLLDQIPAAALEANAAAAWIRPTEGQAVALNIDAMRQLLAAAPMENQGGPAFEVRSSQAVIALPRPDGSFERFAFVESPVMEPALAVQFPQIKTYLGQGLDNPAATVRFDLTHEGFHAQVFTDLPGHLGQAAYYIDPATQGDLAHYTSYWRGALRGVAGRAQRGWTCTTPNIDPPPTVRPVSDRGGGVTRRTVRTAVAATGEYTVFASPPGNPNVASGLAAVVTAINRVNQVYEIDLAVRLVLVGNNNLIIYTDPSTDPYSGPRPDMQDQNQSNLDSEIGGGNYDLGHLFDQRIGGGNAGGIGSVCNNSNKGKGFTGDGAPTGDYFWIDYVAHEIGHQLGGTHTFNNCGDNGQRTGSTAYEPGSGITIMGYAGICGSDNLATAAPPAGASIPTFNFSSIDQIRGKVNEGGTCLAGTSTSNDPPSLTAIPALVLPINTPFTLTSAGASDSGGTASLTYSWEQADLGSAQALGPDQDVGAPLFRPFSPVSSGSRRFPLSPDVSGGSTVAGENLPLFPRNSTFTLLVRDNFAGAGGVNRTNVSVQFVASGGFRVTGPAQGQLECDSSVTVQWDPAGTNAPPIDCANIRIFYSSDGGANYGPSLGTFANTGSAMVTIPTTPTNQGRFRIEGVQQPFFAIGPTFTTDLVAPDITCPTNIVRNNDPGQCGAQVTLTATATDNCPGVTIAYRIGAQPISSPHFFPVGTTTVNATATDAVGLTDACSYTVTIVDNEPPVVSAVDAVVELDEYGNAALTPATFSASATDNCLAPDCPITFGLSQSVFLCPPVNVPIDVTVFATDCHSKTGSRIVTVTFPDPDCNMNGQADICDILSGFSKDCDENRVPDECQCIWDNGDEAASLADIDGQISHIGGGSGDGAKVADDLYLAPGAVYRLFEFNGVMLTDLIAPLRKARVDLFEDCDGVPSGEPIATFETTDAEVLAGPNADGFWLVRYTFDLCDEKLWLDGGRTYWWSLYGVGSCDGEDLSSWVASTSAIAGSVPVKASGLPSEHCHPTDFGPWQPLDECCLGCVNMAYKVVGVACPLIWDNAAAATAAGSAGGVLSENFSPIVRPRGADDFVVKPCADQEVCLIDAWLWTNCDPVQGFVEIYRNDCKRPAQRLHTLTNPTVIETGETLVIGTTLLRGVIIRFYDPDITLEANQSYWLSAAAARTGSQNARTYFAFSSSCRQPCDYLLSPAHRFVPPEPVAWERVDRGLAFRIAAKEPEETDIAPPPPPPDPVGPRCDADINGSGALTVQDLFDFLAAYFAGCP